MISEQATPVEEDAGHIRYPDGHVFHVRGGEITTGQARCPCAGPEPVHQVRSYREAVPQLQISLTDACNMGCTYCSFRERVHADGKPVTMPLTTARQAVAAFRDRTTQDAERYGRVDFGLAGETMLVRHLHEQVHEFVEEGLADTPLSVVWHGPMVTNATLSMTPELAAQIGPPQDISIDGPPDVHDRVRFYTARRRGTYADVRSVLDRVLADHPDLGVSAVLTAYCTDFAMIFRHLFEEVGARNIYMKPVNATHDRDYALNAASLPAFQRGYAELVEHVLAHEPQGILDRLLALNAEDYFMRFFYRVKDRTAQVYRCGAGKSGLYADTNGKLYPCAHFIGKSGWDIGHVSDGVDEAKRQQYLELTVDSREPCRSCAARYVCGGGCYYQAVLANNDIRQPDAVKCELIRFLTSLAVRLVVFLRDRHPEVLDALPRPYGIPPEAAGAAADAPYLPSGRLVRASTDRPVPLGGAGRVRGGLRRLEGCTVGLRRRGRQLVCEATLGRHDAAVEGLRIWLQPLGGNLFTMRDLAVRKPGDSGSLLRVTREGASWQASPAGRFRRIPYRPTDWQPAEVPVEWVDGRIRVLLDLPEDGPDDPLALNVFVDLRDGSWTALAVHEPFVIVDPAATGPLAVTGPDAPDVPVPRAPVLNDDLPVGLLPIGRWAGLQANVC